MVSRGYSMLRLSPKKRSKHKQFFLQILALSFTVHALAIGIYLFVSQRRAVAVNMRMSIVNPNRRVLVLPYVKYTGKLSSAGRTGIQGTITPSSGQRARPRLVKKTVSVKAAPTPAAKNTPKKVTLKQKLKKTLKKHKPTYKEKIKNKKERKKEKALEKKRPHAEPKKPTLEPAPIEQKKELVPEPTKQELPKTPEPIKQEAPKPVTTEPEKQPTQDILPITTTPGSTPNTITDIPIWNTEQKTGDASQGTLVLGQEEYRLLQAYQELHETITSKWHPPVHLHPAQECIILAEIDEAGKTTNLTVEQSSGILAYDSAARMAAYQSTFPDALKKQTVRLHF